MKGPREAGSEGRPNVAEPDGSVEGTSETFRRERELMEAALDAQRDTFFLFEPATGKAIHWNRAFREISGYTDEEIARLPAPASYYGPEDLDRAARFLEQLPSNQSGTIELNLICKAGREVPTEYNASLVLDEQGVPKYVISIGRDVAERKEAEAEVRRHRERLIRFLDSATDSFHLVDRELRILEISESALAVLRASGSGVQSRQDVVGRDLLDVSPFMRGAEAEARFRKVLESGAPELFDAAAEHDVLGTVHMTVRAFKVGDDLGIIATDISERKRAEEERLNLERQMQQAQKLESLGILAGGIAHDFNNLLVGVLGGTELALQHIDESSPAYALLQDVAKSTHRAAELSNQMLAYSGRGRFVVEPVDLTLLIKEMAQLLEATIPKKIPLEYHLDEALPAAQVDVTQVRQIVLNLVVNASEAIGDRVGRISISTGALQSDPATLTKHYLGEEAKEGKYVYLRVQDTGLGMDEATRERIFDPFFSTKSTGRGLGLAAALGIVRGHQGSIKVESAPGRGTTMTVQFPASSLEATQPAAEIVDSDGWTGSGTVLVVDDEEVVRTVGSAMLEEMGFDVLVAENGFEGIEIFRRRADEIVLVLLDLAMPEMSGDEVFEEIRRIKSDVKVLLSSGFSEQDIATQFAVSGISGFIQKPYRLEAFSRKVREVLGTVAEPRVSAGGSETIDAE